MKILNEILAFKKQEVEQRKKCFPIKCLENSKIPQIRDFKSSLCKQEDLAVIAEIKRKSPTRGMIKKDFDPVEIAKIYDKNGAAAVSVLTDEKYFDGHCSYLTAVKKLIYLPVLRKDFIVDEYQIRESRYWGADAILLIVRLLESKQLTRYIAIAREVGLSCLVEVHSEGEIKTAIDSGAEIIGINNRNLDTLKVDINTSLDLMKWIGKDQVAVAESGIQSRSDMIKIESAGFDAVLIGESFMRSKNIGGKLRELSGK